MAESGIIPEVFRKSLAATPSYSYQDIQEGTGVVEYTGTRSVTSAGNAYVLVSYDVPMAGAANNLTAGEGATNFNLSVFNYPKEVKGTAYVTGTLETDNVGKAAFKFQKISGGVTTDISASTETDNINATRGILVTIALTQTTFKRGDNLRLLVTVTGCGGAANGVNVNPDRVGYNPFLIYVPYKIDI